MLRITMQDLVKDALHSGDESASFFARERSVIIWRGVPPLI